MDVNKKMDMLLFDIIIWLAFQEDPLDPKNLIITLFESLKKINRLYMAGVEVTHELFIRELWGDQVKSIFERAMEDPTQRDGLVKLVKGLDPQSTAYSLLPEAVKDLLKD